MLACINVWRIDHDQADIHEELVARAVEEADRRVTMGSSRVGLSALR